MEFDLKLHLTLKYYFKKGYIVPFCENNTIKYFNSRNWCIE